MAVKISSIDAPKMRVDVNKISIPVQLKNDGIKGMVHIQSSVIMSNDQEMPNEIISLFYL